MFLGADYRRLLPPKRRQHNIGLLGHLVGMHLGGQDHLLFRFGSVLGGCRVSEPPPPTSPLDILSPFALCRSCRAPHPSHDLSPPALFALGLGLARHSDYLDLHPKTQVKVPVALLIIPLFSAQTSPPLL